MDFRVLGVSFTHCVTLSKLLHHLKPQFPQLVKEAVPFLHKIDCED